MAIVSIIIPTRDRRELLRRALASVSKQSCGDWECIVADDGSSDGTLEMLADLVQTDDRFHVQTQQQAGASHARNLGADAATGQYLLFLDSDDELADDALEQFNRRLQQSPDAAVICLAADEFDAMGEFSRSHRPRELGPAYGDHKGLFLAGTFLVATSIFREIGAFDTRCRSSQHTEFSLRILEYCRLNHLPVICGEDTVLRIHAHDGVHLRSSLENLLEGGLFIIQTHRDKLARSPKHLSDWCMVTAVYAAKVHDFSRARRLFLAAISAYPKNYRNLLRLMIACIPLLRTCIWKV